MNELKVWTRILRNFRSLFLGMISTQIQEVYIKLNTVLSCTSLERKYESSFSAYSSCMKVQNSSWIREEKKENHAKKETHYDNKKNACDPSRRYDSKDGTGSCEHAISKNAVI